MSSQTGRRIYVIKEVADYVGVTPEAIALAEKQRRIPVARRDELGHRIYSEEDRERIAYLLGRR